MLRTKFFGRPFAPDGLYAILSAAGTTPTATRKYTFQTDSYVPATSLAAGTNIRWGVGNSVKALYGGSNTGGTVQYFFGSDTSSVGTTLPTSSGSFGGGAAGNASLAIASVPATTGATNKYVYSTNTTSVSSSINASSTVTASAVGNSVEGIFANSTVAGAATSKYTYGTDTAAPSTALPQRGGIYTSMTNKDFGLFNNAAGSIMSKYTFSGDITSTATALTNSGNFYTAACGNSISGVIFASNTPGNGIGAKYIYSNDTVFATTTLNITLGAAVSNGVLGVNV